jgi:hypothetical protein
MTRTGFLRFLARGLTAVSIGALAACGGGSSTTLAGGGVIGGTGSIIGTGSKGPVANGTATAYAVSGGSPRDQLGSAMTDASGRFSLSIGNYSGAVMLQLSGGSYTDEATGTAMNMAAGDVMTAVLPTVAAGASVSGIQITPLTSMAQSAAKQMPGGMTDANIASANRAVGTYFMVSDILHVAPMNPLVAGSGSTGTQDSINYGMALAAMSQYAKNIGMTASSAMVTAMMNDASDGMMDGKMGSSFVMMGGMGTGMGMAMPGNAGTSGLASAMSTFAGSAQNKSGVSASMMQALINQLDASNGQLFATGSASAQGMIVGTAFNGTTKQATVRAFAINNGSMGAQIGGTTTDAQGNFTIAMGAYTGPVMLQVVGATYTDLAVGSMMTMGSNDTMTTVLPTVASGSTTSGVWVTPLTSMAQMRAQTMAGGMTDVNIRAANTAVGNYFMMSDIVHTKPMDPGVPGSAAATTPDEKYCGAAIAAMSQYAKGLTMQMSYSFVTAMMNDAADGVMDGRMNGTAVSMSMGGMMGSMMMQPTAGTSGLAMAMSSFMTSGANLSGATTSDVAALIQKLTSSSGVLQ